MRPGVSKRHSAAKQRPALRSNFALLGCCERNRFYRTIQRRKSDRIYTKFEGKLTELVWEIDILEQDIRDRKRLSLALSCNFLELNGYDYVVHYFAEEIENIVLWVENGKIGKELSAEIINSLIQAKDYSEELKLKIAIAISHMK